MSKRIILKGEEIVSEEYMIEYINQILTDNDFATKEDITEALKDIEGISLEIVTTLPTTNIVPGTIYLIKDETVSTEGNNIYNEYIYINGKWENLGTTNTTIDMSNYSTTEEMNAAIEEAISNIETGGDVDLTDYATKEYVDDTVLGATQTNHYICTASTNNPGFFNFSVTHVRPTSTRLLEIMEEGFTNIAKGINEGFVLDYSPNNNSVANWNNVTIHTNYIKPSDFAQLTSYELLAYTQRKAVIYLGVLTVNGTWENDTFTCTNVVQPGSDGWTQFNFDLLLTKANTKEYTPTSDYNPATKKYVDDAISTSIAGISTTSMEIATSLPTENISISTIYLVKDETASTDTENIYNEYIYVNGAWENIGSTKTTVDLSNYYTKEKIENLLKPVVNEYHVE